MIFSGPSGVGKGTVLRQFLAGRENVCYSVSATTRCPRDGEVDGRDYHFVTCEAFRQMADQGDMLEYAVYNGNYYGTPKSFCDRQLAQGKDVVLEIEVQGALQVKKKIPEALAVFVLPPSLEELERRLRGRGTEEEEVIQKRLRIAREEIALADRYDFVIVNSRLEEAVKSLELVLEAGRRRPCMCRDFLENMREGQVPAL